jgi:hypothetical protein
MGTPVPPSGVLLQRPVHDAVNIGDAAGHLTDLADVPERRDQQHFQREHQALGGVIVKAAVLGHSGRDQRMG